MKKTGIVGWRGMVGSVLLDRMKTEGDFKHFKPCFASSSQKGQTGPDVGVPTPPLFDAYDIDKLGECDIILTCHGSDYTRAVYPKLRDLGWNGYWIDASSALRTEKSSVIVLDPVNREVIESAIAEGAKEYIGGNCTVSLMLMAIGELLKKGLVEWISTMTYQAASGAGAANLRELVAQMVKIGADAAKLTEDTSMSVLTLDRCVTDTLLSETFPVQFFGAPLAGSALPWIDSKMESGQTREEWKGFFETNKILQTKKPIPVDGVCVRIGAMRCHAQALTIKLNDDISLEEIESIIESGNDWVEVVPNNKEDTLRLLTPAAVAGKLVVRIGRLRKMLLGTKYLGAFTVGDQLLWGAAEPLRRVLRMILSAH